MRNVRRDVELSRNERLLSAKKWFIRKYILNATLSIVSETILRKKVNLEPNRR